MKKLLLILCILLCNNKLFAESTHWRLNKDHSEIYFKVPYLSISSITGSFSRFNGWVRYDDDVVLANYLELHIYANSIYTGNNMRDGHLKSADFLDSKKFPKIIFKSDKITPIAPSTFRADGTLTIKNVTKPFSIEYFQSDEQEDGWQFKSKFIKFKGKLNREFFELDWNKSLKNNQLLVGNEINFNGVFQIQPSGKLTPSSHHMIPNTKYIEMRDKKLRGEAVEGYNENSLTDYSNQTISQNIAIEAKKTLEIGNQEQIILDIRNSPKWQASFCFLVLLGLASTFILATQSSFYINNFVKDKYQGALPWSNLSSLVTITFVILYLLAIWNVGWGS